MIKFVCDRCGKVIEDDYDRCHKPFSTDKLNKNEEAYEVFKEMEYEAKIQELEQKLADMTKNRDWWRTQCKEFYEDYKTLAEKLERRFQHKGIKL